MALLESFIFIFSMYWAFGRQMALFIWNKIEIPSGSNCLRSTKIVTWLKFKFRRLQSSVYFMSASPSLSLTHPLNVPQSTLEFTLFFFIIFFRSVYVHSDEKRNEGEREVSSIIYFSSIFIHKLHISMHYLDSFFLYFPPCYFNLWGIRVTREEDRDCK